MFDNLKEKIFSPRLMTLEPEEGNPEFLDSLTLDIEDNVLATFINKRIKASQDFYEKKGIPRRQEENLRFLLGKHIEDNEYKTYQQIYSDNAIYEAESTIKPIAMSRLPDLTVKPGKHDDESRQTAKEISDILNSIIRTRENRKALAMAFKHHPIFFIGAIKYRWDENKGKLGDYVFEFIHPRRLVLDHNANTCDVEKMGYVGEKLSISVDEVIARFPKVKEKVLERLGILDGEKVKLSTEIDIYEVWFKFRQDGKVLYGVAWKFEDIILGKKKNPNIDYGGVERPSMDLTTARDSLLQSLLSGVPNEGMELERTFNNYFESPEFPYIFLGYDQLGEMPYDETSRIEQVKYLQKDIDDVGGKITDMIRRGRGKHVLSSSAGINAEQMEEMDLDDPESDLLVNGKVADVYTYIQNPLPDASLFEDRNQNKQAIFSKMGTHSTTRGEKETDTATTSQILREADYGRIDDITEETINYAAERMARAAMQMIKLRYTEDHFIRRLGKDGSVIFHRINRDMIEDGMEVVVGASATDKIERKRQALELARQKLIDPLTFFEDMELPDAQNRAERLMAFTLDPNGYITKYIMGLETTEEMVGAIAPELIPPQAQEVETIAPTEALQ